MILDITEQELQEVNEDILTILGAFTIDVDLQKKEILTFLKLALREFEKETSIWQLQNQFGNVYGMPAGMITTNHLATQNFQLVNQITDWFGSMARVGGKIPWHKDYITLEPGRQIYDLSKESSKPYPTGTRRIHRVMWVARPEMMNSGRYSENNASGDDILYSNNWNFTTNGLNYGASPLAYMGYTFDTIMLMQSAEHRNNLLFSEFFHNLSGDILEITPSPGANVSITDELKVFYYYWEESEVALNGKDDRLYQSSEVSDSVDGGPYGLPPGQAKLIANPTDMKLEHISWSGLSPWAKTWVFDHTLARCKYNLGAKWRKIKKTMGQGEMTYEIEFDYQSLLSEADQDMVRLKEDLRSDLKELSITKILQDKAEQVAAAGKVSSRVPRMWFFQTLIPFIVLSSLFLL